jgi:hypothetical protein
VNLWAAGRLRIDQSRTGDPQRCGELAQAEQAAAVADVGEYLVGLGHVAGEPVVRGDGDDVAVPNGCQGLVQSCPVDSAGAGEFAVDVDPVRQRVRPIVCASGFGRPSA